eukprot:scaffold72755_cov92-Phaeocystis_antarctica.AAC.1
MQGLHGDHGDACADGVPLGRRLAYPLAFATCGLRAFFAKVEVTRRALPRLLAVDDGVAAMEAVASHHVDRLDAKGQQQQAVAVRTLHCARPPSRRRRRSPAHQRGIRSRPKSRSRMSQGACVSRRVGNAPQS